MGIIASAKSINFEHYGIISSHGSKSIWWSQLTQIREVSTATSMKTVTFSDGSKDEEPGDI